MLFLGFQIGPSRYVLPSGQIAQIVPYVQLKDLPRAPAGVAGILNFRGKPAPVIDLSELLLGTAARRRLSTRIMLVNYRAKPEAKLLGLIAEQATELVRRAEEDFVDPGIACPEARCLGRVAADGDHFLQLVSVEDLVTPPIRELLFQLSSGD